MTVLVLGFLTGLALVAPIGPISVTLVGVGATSGRQSALRAAGGVASADVVMMATAFSLGAVLLSAPPNVLRWIHIVLGVVLLGIGVMMIGEAAKAVEVAGRVRRPGLTLFLGTMAHPLTLIVWLGVAAAAPYAGDRLARSLFIGGLALATVVWHGGLALASAALGARMSPGFLVWGSRVAGVVVIGLGIGALVSSGGGIGS